MRGGHTAHLPAEVSGGWRTVGLGNGSAVRLFGVRGPGRRGMSCCTFHRWRAARPCGLRHQAFCEKLERVLWLCRVFFEHNHILKNTS